MVCSVALRSFAQLIVVDCYLHYCKSRSQREQDDLVPFPAMISSGYDIVVFSRIIEKDIRTVILFRYSSLFVPFISFFFRKQSSSLARKNEREQQRLATALYASSSHMQSLNNLLERSLLQ